MNYHPIAVHPLHKQDGTPRSGIRALSAPLPLKMASGDAVVARAKAAPVFHLVPSSRRDQARRSR
jgi:hypothetical protein